MMRKRLGEVCRFYSGTGFPVQYQGENEEELPFYKVGDIANNVVNGNIYLELCNNYISRETASIIKGTVIPKDTVVFAKIGEALKLNRRAITSCDCLIDNNAMGIAPKTEYLRTRYFYYFMKQLKMQDHAESTTVPSVRKSKLENIEIDVPTLDAQSEIEALLDKTTAVILLRQQELQKLDELIKARFVEVFGMPGTDINGWGLKKLGDCCELNPKKGKDSRLVSGLEVSFVPMPAVSENGAIDPSDVKLYDDVKTGFTYFAENDVLMAKITPCMENGKGAVAVGLTNGIGFGSTEFHVLRPIKGISNPYWIYVMTVIKAFREDAASNMTGSAGQRRVPATFLDNYKVALPPIDVQEQFAAFVKQIDKSKVVVPNSLSHAA